MTFQSTPRKGSDRTASRPLPRSSYFNPRSPWGERPDRAAIPATLARISIHVPRGGSDYFDILFMTQRVYFNPRSPWGERQRMCCDQSAHLLFQSTLPVGGATLQTRQQRRIGVISIHAPRGGSDLEVPGIGVNTGDFNPRSPWGERPACARAVCSTPYFNPRSPWGSDQSADCCVRGVCHFNPRSPWGSDLCSVPPGPGGWHFNPRSPWGSDPRASRS